MPKKYSSNDSDFFFGENDNKANDFMNSGNENGSGAVGDYGAVTTKQRILYCAASLFATKGFTETSVRELAAAAGLQGSSIYNHFKSKTAILEYMLEEYKKYNSGAFFEDSMRDILKENPTTEGILSCLQLKFDEEVEEYFTNVLSMIMQEQHRNPVINEYVRQNIETSELHIKLIIEALQDFNVLRPDVDPDYWMKLASSLFYTFSNRMVLGNGDRSPNYQGMSMHDMFKQLFDNLLRDCGIRT